MRRLLLTALVTIGLALPATAGGAPFTASIADAGQPFARASGVCVCVAQFTDAYVRNSYNVRGRVLAKMAKRISFPWRNRFNRGVYDWKKGGYGTKKNWCKRNLKACRAVITCMAAAGGYWLNAPSVISRRELMKGAAKNCALAATVAIISP